MTRKHHSAEHKIRITADLGAKVPVDCVALISTTLGAGGRGINGCTPIRAFTEGIQKPTNTEATSQTKTAKIKAA